MWRVWGILDWQKESFVMYLSDVMLRGFGSNGRLDIWVKVNNDREVRKPDPTYLLSPHLVKQVQWKVCEHGTVTSPVTAESILSRQTGQVGSS